MGFLRRRRPRLPAPPPPAAEGGVEASRAFGYKCAWLALRSTEPAAVAAALGLAGVRSVPWPEGVQAVCESGPDAPGVVFVTAPVDAWVLVPYEFGLDDGPDVFDLADLSARFGEAQRFATHRVVELHRWERWVGGEAVRRYAYVGESGEVLRDEGALTEPEAALGLLRQSDADPDWERVEFADEQFVMTMAGLWSVDPTELDRRGGLGDEGLLGRR